MAAILSSPQAVPAAKAGHAALPAPAPIQQLHHYAYRARDAEETRHFYEDILGLPLYHIIQSDYVPSTGEYCPYTHFFFRLQDGSFIAFFDLGDDEALYGIYEGEPLTDARSVEDGAPIPVMPTIRIFRKELEQDFPNREDLIEQIRITVIHEVGHHFGLDDDAIDKLGFG